MSLYYDIQKFEIRDLPDSLYLGWIETNNPKKDYFQPVPEKPSFDPVYQKEPYWGLGQWLVENKSEEELAADTRKSWDNSSMFIQEFTLTEMAAISLSQDTTVAALRLLLSTWFGEVWSDDPRVQSGLSALINSGIINEARRDEILAK
jgi:hypothetical protein